MVIVRAGGLTLHAPDEVPADARGPLEAAHEQARFGQPLPAEVQIAIEDAAYGREAASRLRRQGIDARFMALRQLLAGWREGAPRPSIFAREG